jgi:phosphatidylserine decarboxylase
MADVHDRVSRSRAVIAHEGWIWLLLSIVAGVIAARLGYIELALVFAALTLFLALLFSDPGRVVPPLPAAVYAPVDGRVVSVEPFAGQGMERGWTRVRVRVSRLGAYTIRAPIEGTIEEIRDEAVRGVVPAGLCVCSEEGDRVLLMFPKRGLLRSPKAFVRYGERLGQGERFAYLRLAPLADVYLPETSRVVVAEGDRVRAGDTALAELIYT